jgi:hypothetical protein
MTKKKTPTPPRPPVPTPRPKPRPPIESGPDQILRERRRLAAPMNEPQMQEISMKTTRTKGLGFSVNKRPVSEDGARRMPYTPGSSEARPMPYKPGTGTTKTLPMPYKPRLDPVRKMSYDAPVMDSLGDPSPPGYADTMEYVPERDGDAWGQGGPYEGEDPGFENLGKQEENRKWKYDNWRSEEGRPIPEDQANVFNDLYDEWSRKRPIVGENENPTEVAQWERSVRRSAAEAGLSEEEIEQLINDLYDLD